MHSMITLRNGDQVPTVIAQTTIMTLRHLHAEHPAALLSLIRLAHDPEYELLTTDQAVLRHFAITKANGSLHPSVASTVISATEVTGDTVRLIPPATR